MSDAGGDPAEEHAQIRTDQISHSLLYGATRTYAPAAVLLGTDLLEPLQGGRHGLEHRIGPVDPLPALAQEDPPILIRAAVKYLGDDRGVVTVRSEAIAPAVTRRDA